MILRFFKFFLRATFYKKFINNRKKYLGKRDFLGAVNEFLKRYSKINKNSKKVLMWELGGFNLVLRKDAIISIALKTRGVDSIAVICDGTPKACMQRDIQKGKNIDEWGYICKKCQKANINEALKYGLKYSLLSEYFTENELVEIEQISKIIDLNNIRSYKYLGVSVGELAFSSFLRFGQGHQVDYLKTLDEYEAIYRQYFFAALLNTLCAKNAIEKIKPLSVFESHGVYTDYAPAVFMAKLKNINTLCWSSGYDKYLHYYDRPKTVSKLIFRGISDEKWEARKSKPLTSIQNKLLDDMIYNRYFSNSSDDINFLSKPKGKEILKKDLKIENNNKIICLFPHINWDVGSDFTSMIFEDSDEWIIESIKKMIEIKDVNWLVRIHPAEKMHNTPSNVGDMVKRVFPVLPEHVKILYEGQSINTYDLIELIDIGITISGTIGNELPLFGKPVITAGEAQYSGKGFSIMANNRDEYFKILKTINNIKPLNDEQIQNARKSAYSYFFERQIPFEVQIKNNEEHWADLDLNSIEELLPGKNKGIDKICEGIIFDKDVILEKY